MQQHIVHDTSNLPIELYTKPLALIGFSGLDTVNNAIHKSIWEAFSNARRIENAPVHYKLISNAHEFPVIKPKRNSYDWYIPKGILKRNWMNKYLNEIPAVMVIFYDLDWDDSLWNEKMIECASRVQSIRATLEGRNTRIIVVLIQNTVPLPHGDHDQLASERAVSLCASCELNSTSLYVLPHGDHLMGYVTRLEMAFFEFAQNYYYGEIKNVKSHKEHLNKTTHQYLIVRHQFKLGFLNELKQDKHTALKHYNYAYNNLLEIRIVDTNALEIRTIAGFINYKLCRLMFYLNLPRDAITQFKTHIDRFKNRIGFYELSFEHYAWLSKQFSVFGDIFDEAVKLGLPAVQTQHPGIYYQQAAQYAIIRKRTCFELCTVNEYPQPDPLDGWNFMEFYGQRPWRPGKLTAEPPDPQLESNGIKALQFLEKQVAHSSIIVALFGLAISQYKTYRCPRTRRHLVLQMADEYYDSHDYGKALTLLTHMLWDFRNENWWLLLTDILKKALRCAFLTINLQDYILLSLEILNKSCKLNENDRKLIYTNFCRILQKQVPIISDCDATLLKQWETLLKTSSPIKQTLDLTNIPCCIEIKPRFVKKRYQIDEQIQVEIYVKSTSNYCMNFTKLSLNINTTINLEFTVDNKQQNISFAPNETKRFTIAFQPEPDYLNKELQISCINLTMGNPNVCLIDLKFSNFNNNNNNNKIPELIHFKYTNDKIDFDNIQSNALSALIVPRNSRLSLKLECSPPVLLGEWFPIKIHISNDEDYNIKDIMVQIKSLDDESTTHTEFSTIIDGGTTQQLPLILPLKSKYLQHNEQTFVNFYIRAHKLIENHIEIKISYVLDCDKSIISIKSENLHLPIVVPFELETKFLSKLMFEIDKFYVGEQIGIMPILRCQSPWPIIIENTHLEFTQPFQTINNDVNNRLNMMKLNDKEIGTEIFLGVCNKSIKQNVTIGQYFIKWKRENGTSTTSQLAIIGHPCEWIPLELSLTIPAHGLVRTPLLVVYHFLNRSQQLLQLDVSMEASEAFMFSGYRQFSISILPESTKTIQYNLYPLIAGSVALPKLQLTMPDDDNNTEKNDATLTTEQLKFLIERSLPTHLYVMPQIKGNPKISEIVRARKTC